MVRGLTPDSWAISVTVASNPRRATTAIAASLMRDRVSSCCCCASEGGGRPPGSATTTAWRWACTVRSPFEVNVHGTSCYERATPYCDEGFRFGHVRLAGDGCQQGGWVAG